MKNIFKYLIIVFFGFLYIGSVNAAEVDYTCEYAIPYADKYVYFKGTKYVDGNSKIEASYIISGGQGKTYYPLNDYQFTVGNLSNTNIKNLDSKSMTNSNNECIPLCLTEETFNYHFSETTFAPDKCDSGTKTQVATTQSSNNSSTSSGSSSSQVTITNSCDFTMRTGDITGLPDKKYFVRLYMKSNGKRYMCATNNLNNLNSSCKELSDGSNTTVLINLGSDSYYINMRGSTLNSFFRQNAAQLNNSTFSCPTSIYQIYTSVGDSTITLSTDASEVVEWDNSVIGDAGNEGEIGINPVDETETEEVLVGCPLGPKVTEDLKGVFNIFKIVGPLLVIALTTYEFIKALTKGDVQNESKKLTTRLVKRIVFAILLFALPVLIAQFGAIIGIWDADMMCTFDNYGEAVSDNSGNTIQTTTKKIPKGEKLEYTVSFLGKQLEKCYEKSQYKNMAAMKNGLQVDMSDNGVVMPEQMNCSDSQNGFTCKFTYNSYNYSFNVSIRESCDSSTVILTTEEKETQCNKYNSSLCDRYGGEYGCVMGDDEKCHNTLYYEQNKKDDEDAKCRSFTFIEGITMDDYQNIQKCEAMGECALMTMEDGNLMCRYKYFTIN